MILGIDIGGTTVKLGLIDREGRIHAQTEVSVCFDGYETPILTTVLRAAKAFLQRENTAVEGAGISATGQIDDEHGVVIGTNGKIPHYEGARFKADTEAALQAPVWALNDANAAALGEAFTGGARGYREVVMLTLGTGVGGGLILNGRLYSGARGIAGELGHFTLYQDGRKCPCGKRGCLEEYASTTALIARAERQTGRTGWNGRMIFGRHRAGAYFQPGAGADRRRRQRAGGAAAEAPACAGAGGRDAPLCRETAYRTRRAG